MRKILTVGLLCLGIISLHGQSLRLSNLGKEDTDLNKADKKKVTQLLSDAIQDNYYDRDGVKDLLKFLTELKKADAYKNSEKASVFSRLITEALRGETKDPHFNLFYSPDLFRQAERMLAGPPAATSSRASLVPGKSQDARLNYFMPKAEVLEGNVAYLKLTQMADIRQAKATVDAAMAFLGNSDASILDLRGNRGGIGGFTPYMASYFFEEEGKLLFSREMPAYDSVSRFYTEKELPAPRLTEQPLYVLIDGFTGSAARNLAYTLQQHGRAALVGEETGVGTAGAHSASIFPLTNGFVATLPIANVVHPVSKSNWSMVGVVPDYAVTASKAHEAAHRLAIEKLLITSDAQTKEALQNALEALDANEKEAGLVKPDKSLPAGHQEYVGRYDVRSISFKEDKLYFQRDGQPALEMALVSPDRFKMVLPPGVRVGSPLPQIRFDRDDAGKVVSISFLDAQEKVLSSYKKQ